MIRRLIEWLDLNDDEIYEREGWKDYLIKGSNER